MAEDYRHGTATMAKLFAQQGHWGKAATIYRYLLAKEPEREDLASALAEAEARMEAAEAERYQELVPLFREWIDLLLKYDRLQKLRRLSQRL